MITIACPRCGSTKPAGPPYGKPPKDGSAPLLGAICDCGALFMFRLLEDGPDLVPITPEMAAGMVRQPGFKEMMAAWVSATKET
jgi:hypothetical protein